MIVIAKESPDHKILLFAPFIKTENIEDIACYSIDRGWATESLCFFHGLKMPASTRDDEVGWVINSCREQKLRRAYRYCQTTARNFQIYSILNKTNEVS